MVKPGFAKRCLFGRAKPPLNRWLPAYLRLDWRQGEGGEDVYDMIRPPIKGEITLSYFAVSFNEWVSLLNRYQENKMMRGEVERHVRKISFKTFPEAFTLWDDLIARFEADEITSADVIMGMLKASKEAEKFKT